MWFHLEPKGKEYTGSMSGVAVADKITGPFQFVDAFRPNRVSGIFKIHYSAITTPPPEANSLITNERQ
jgi:hypothetical protein